MIKLSIVQLKESIRTADSTETVLYEKDYDLTLRDGIIVDVVSKKSGKMTHTSLFNVKGWTQCAHQPKEAKKAK